MNGRMMAVVCAAWIAALVAIAGCGKSGGESGSSTVASANAASVTEQPSGTVPAGEPSKAEGLAAGGGEAGVRVTGDSLPPDVMIASVDSLATPGQAIEITAKGSGDVVSMSLWDGLGQRQAFRYDQGTQEWRVLYRVPLKLHTERLALAVTAKNGSNGWRRVWLFPQVGGEAPTTHPEPNSGK